MIRLIAIVNAAAVGEIKVKHYRGLPPELTGERDERELLPLPDILFIEQVGDAFYLYRFSKSGTPLSDTWHQNLADAKHQADFEYGAALGAWRAVPDGVDDIVAFATSRGDSRKKRG